MSENFPKHVRVRRKADFDSVYHSKHYAADQVLVMQARANGLNITRLGLSVGRKVGNAPTRNRWKRVIREVFRKSRLRLPDGLDLVVRPRKGAQLSYAAIEKSFPRLVARIVKKLPPIEPDQ